MTNGEWLLYLVNNVFKPVMWVFAGFGFMTLFWGSCSNGDVWFWLAVFGIGIGVHNFIQYEIIRGKPYE